MRLPDENEQQNTNFGPSVFLALAAVTLFACGLFLAVVLWNERKEKSAERKTDAAVSALSYAAEEKNADLTGLLSGSTLSPDDLDFWDKYPVETKESAEVSPEPTKKPKDDPSTDGKHTRIVNRNGEEEWVLISPYLPKNEYDFTKLVCQSEKMKYFEDGRQISFVGADISKLQDYIDFQKVKKAGLDFVMVRVGARGYSSGQLVMDDYFSENVKRASDAGLQVGVYFFSQAVSAEEAVVEANLVLEAVKDYRITYPIAFYMSEIAGDTSRIDVLTKQDRTNVARAFLDTIKAAGYLPMLYGDKEWLLKEVDLSKLTAYDVWLSQIQDVPDYPYKFSMWRYSTTGTVDGIAGYADLNISFVDYSEK